MEPNVKGTRKPTLFNVNYADFPVSPSENTHLMSLEGHTTSGIDSLKSISPPVSQKTFNFLPVITENDESTPNHLQANPVIAESLLTTSGARRTESTFPRLNLKGSSIDKFISTRNLERPNCFSPKVRKSLQIADDHFSGSSFANKRQFRKADTFNLTTKTKESSNITKRYQNGTKVLFSQSPFERKIIKKDSKKEEHRIQKVHRATTLSLMRSTSSRRKATYLSRSPISQMTLLGLRGLTDSDRSPSLRSQYQLHLPSYRTLEV